MKKVDYKLRSQVIRLRMDSPPHTQ